MTMSSIKKSSSSLKRHMNMMSLLQGWKKRKAQRNYLKGVPPYQLNDIGVSQQQASSYAARPSWK